VKKQRFYWRFVGKTHINRELNLNSTKIECGSIDNVFVCAIIKISRETKKYCGRDIKTKIYNIYRRLIFMDNNTLNIGNKISEYRREKGSTQEQLADYVGVSVAAVSKWETNQSYPDITLLKSIAEFFEVSIDSLLEYNTTDGYTQNLKKAHDLISDIKLYGDYEKGLPIVLECLKKYPNDFILLENAGYLLGDRMLSHNDENLLKKDAVEAISYFEKAIKCMSNEEEKRKVAYIKKYISFIYLKIGDYETAMQKLSEINIGGAFDADVARIKYTMGEKKECKKILQNKVWNTAYGFWLIIGQLANCYVDEGNLEMALETQKLHANYLLAFTWDTPNCADCICAWSYFKVAEYCKKLNRIADMWENLEKSVYHAVKYDKNPSTEFISLKFMDECNGDAISTSPGFISPSILKDLQNDFKEFESDERHIKFCEELNAAKKTKVEAGVWGK
jgi:transcriptional regulator with XRE-family HTH domain